MAHLWQHEPDNDQWAVRPLDGEAALTDGVVLLPTSGERGGGWVLVASAGVEVGINGFALKTGFYVLADRDEIRVNRRREREGGETYFFSTETLAAIEPFTGGERRLFCPRCKDELAPGDASVKCPQCRLVHHQSEDRPCWTYAETCAACSQRSDLQSGYRWTPDAI